MAFRAFSKAQLLRTCSVLAEDRSTKICYQIKERTQFSCVQSLFCLNLAKKKMNAAIIHRRENGRTGHCGVGRDMRTGGPHAEV